MSKLINLHRVLLKSACLLMLAACGPVKTPTAEAIAGDPNRMRDLMRQCKVEWAKVGDATCTAVSEAWRRRFMGKREAQDQPAQTKSAPTATQD